MSQTTTMQRASMIPHIRTLRHPGALALAPLLALALACGGAEGTDTGLAADTAAQQTLELGPQDVARVREMDLAGGVVLTGSLEPSRVVPIQAQVAGTMTDLRADRGTPVRRGQVMAVIQAAGVRSQAASARAGVAAAEANLALAQQRLDAARTLHQAGAMSDIDFRTAQSGFEAAQAQLAAARGQAASATEDASRATIKAPITGVVSRRSIEAGQPVQVGDPLFTVVNSETLELAGQIPVEQAASVEVGQPVVFTLSGQRNDALRGTVARKDPTADPATRQVGVYVRLPNPDGRIVGGQFARGQIMSGRNASALVVPEAAVRGAGDSTYVLVVEEGRTARRAVELGTRDESAGVIGVTSGLEAGEVVVTTPGGAILPGTSVRIAGAPGGAPRTAADTAAAAADTAAARE